MDAAARAALRTNLERVNARIAAACARVGRDPAEVTLIAVTKYVGAEVMDELVAAGVTHLGENRLQVAEPKLATMQQTAEHHFIGPLQTNKTRRVLELFGTIHSLDRLSLAESIEKRAAELQLESVPCFVEVNVANEVAKSGFAPSQLFAVLREIQTKFGRVNLMGLMCIPPAESDPEAARPHFRLLRKLGLNAVEEGFVRGPFSALSMGMSGDFEVAIEEGATHVRVGSALFDGVT